MDTLLLIDNSSLVYRAFYALPNLTDAKGRPVGAIYGFSNMLLKILTEFRPQYVVAAADVAKQSFRNQLYDGYKATRSATPQELIEQFSAISELYAACGIKYLGFEGYEADDIIGSIAQKVKDNNVKTYIITGDKDCFQLIDKTTNILFMRKGITDMEVVDTSKFNEIYGLSPKQIVDLKALMGDKSDNIPGVIGVGEKGAIKLLNEYGSLANILRQEVNAVDKKGAIWQKIFQQKERAELSYRLATIKQDIEADFSLPQFHWDISSIQCKSFLQEYNLSSIEKRYSKLWVNKEPEIINVVNEKMNYTLITENNLETISNSLRQQSHIYIYIMAKHEEDGYLAQGTMFCDINRMLYYADATSACWPLACEMFANYKGIIVTNDVKNLYAFFLVAFDAQIIDLCLCDYLLNPLSNDHSISAMCARYGGGDLAVDSKKDISINSIATLTIRMVKLLDSISKNVKIWECGLYKNIERPLARLLANMEKTGIAIDKDKLLFLSTSFDNEIEQNITSIYELAGRDFNLNSPKQLAELLFEQLQLPTIKKTKTGYSTNAEVLHELIGLHPIIEKILEYRSLAKLKSGFLDSLNNCLSNNNKIHTIFNQMVTVTGRLSSSEPNLQNIPIRSSAGKKIRELFIPSVGYDCIVSADYSQIELRILAHLSEDETLLQSFANNMDIHTKTASEIFAIPENEITEFYRSKAKAVNFGIIYGISDYGLARDSGVTINEAKTYIENYFLRYPKVKEYFQHQIDFARKNGYVKTLLDRRRNIPEINSKNYNLRAFAERTAMNTPIQGSAADIIKLAMLEVAKEVERQGLRSRMLLQVHDELVFESFKNEVVLLQKILQEKMQNAIALNVSLVVEVKSGANWAECK